METSLWPLTPQALGPSELLSTRRLWPSHARACFSPGALQPDRLLDGTALLPCVFLTPQSQLSALLGGAMEPCQGDAHCFVFAFPSGSDKMRSSLPVSCCLCSSPLVFHAFLSFLRAEVQSVPPAGSVPRAQSFHPPLLLHCQCRGPRAEKTNFSVIMKRLLTLWPLSRGLGYPWRPLDHTLRTTVLNHWA